MSKYQISYFNRIIGIIITLFPFVIIGLSFYLNYDSNFINLSLIFGSIGILITILNLCYFLRPLFWKKWYGNMNGYSNKSQLPLIGTVFGLLCLGFGFGYIVSTIISLIIFILDTGGFLWFIFATWSDESFWDNEKVEK
jgi:hypothetical protein